MIHSFLVVLVKFPHTFAVIKDVCRVPVMYANLASERANAVVDFTFDTVGYVVEKVAQGVAAGCGFGSVEEVLANLRYVQSDDGVLLHETLFRSGKKTEHGQDERGKAQQNWEDCRESHGDGLD